MRWKDVVVVNGDGMNGHAQRQERVECGLARFVFRPPDLENLLRGRPGLFTAKARGSSGGQS